MRPWETYPTLSGVDSIHPYALFRHVLDETRFRDGIITCGGRIYIIERFVQPTMSLMLQGYGFDRLSHRVIRWLGLRNLPTGLTQPSNMCED